MKLYNVKAVARFLDLTERRVRQLKDQNIITEYNNTPGLYELMPTNHAYINYLRKRNPESAENIDYNTERAKLIKAKRQNEEYDLRVKEGSLHETAEIEAVMTDMLLNFKSRLMAIPSKLSQVLSKKTDKAEIHRILKDSVDEALNELADFDKIFTEGKEADKNV
jgi:phage terminase Nu1 subunit (DNA packaging protein)